MSLHDHAMMENGNGLAGIDKIADSSMPRFEDDAEPPHHLLAEDKVLGDTVMKCSRLLQLLICIWGLAAAFLSSPALSQTGDPGTSCWDYPCNVIWIL